ncbi:MAG TPA: ATPase domain-containing protein [Candidatus Binatia bacterium]|nr:ATPase domain-containing protein [Candidatus Binatia bacterium]
MVQENPAPAVKRVSTGIAALDSLLQGGFLPSRSYLVSGDAGTGKTTTCMQFLKSGLEQAEKAVYVTLDERPAEILQAAESLGWDLQQYVQAKNFAILDASPYFSGRAGNAGDKGVDLQKIVSDLAAYAKKLDAARLVIDPVTPLILSGDSPTRVQEHARLLIHLLQSNLTTTNLLTSHLPPQANHNLTNGIEEFLAAGVLILRVTQDNDRSVRTLSVKKMRGTPVEPNEYPFSIVKDHGIFIVGADKKPIPVVVDEPGFQRLEFFQLPKE